MTNYAERETCFYYGEGRAGKGGQVEISNHGVETEEEEIVDGGNQGGIVMVVVPRGGGSQTRVSGRSVDVVDRYGSRMGGWEESANAPRMKTETKPKLTHPPHPPRKTGHPNPSEVHTPPSYPKSTTERDPSRQNQSHLLGLSS